PGEIDTNRTRECDSKLAHSLRTDPTAPPQIRQHAAQGPLPEQHVLDFPGTVPKATVPAARLPQLPRQDESCRADPPLRIFHRQPLPAPEYTDKRKCVHRNGIQ